MFKKNASTRQAEGQHFAVGIEADASISNLINTKRGVTVRDLGGRARNPQGAVATIVGPCR